METKRDASCSLFHPSLPRTRYSRRSGLGEMDPPPGGDTAGGPPPMGPPPMGPPPVGGAVRSVAGRRGQHRRPGQTVGQPPPPVSGPHFTRPSLHSAQVTATAMTTLSCRVNRRMHFIAYTALLASPFRTPPSLGSHVCGMMCIPQINGPLSGGLTPMQPTVPMQPMMVPVSDVSCALRAFVHG